MCPKCKGVGGKSRSPDLQSMMPSSTSFYLPGKGMHIAKAGERASFESVTHPCSVLVATSCKWIILYSEELYCKVKSIIGTEIELA